MSTLSLVALARVSIAAGLMTCAAGGAVITFDGLPDPYYNSVPNNYGGLQWANFSYLNTVYNASLYGPNGYTAGTISGPRVAYNAYGAPASITGPVFNLDSAYLTAAFNDGLQVEVQGFIGSTLSYDHIYVVDSTAPSFVTFDYLNVDKVIFISSGGVAHGYPNGGGTQFVMDNLTLSVVPEPSSTALLLVAAGVWLTTWGSRRKRSLALNAKSPISGQRGHFSGWRMAPSVCIRGSVARHR